MPVLIEALRRAIAKEDKDRETLRTIGDQLELSFSGVRKLIKGAEPRPATVGKLRKWFVREGWKHLGTDVDADTARAAFEILLDGVPPGARREALIERWLKELATLREETGAPPAEWIEAVAEELKDERKE
ncbi:MAG TPA: hypothetical protein VFQ39_19125 [Longimicrobium sp.]|nr:hypothetical protein [Longimicrobium sp.]